MLTAKQDKPLSHEMLRIITATHHDPFEVLGRHPLGAAASALADTLVRVYLPGARTAAVLADEQQQALTRIEGTDFFEWHGLAKTLPVHYQVQWFDRHNQMHTEFDPYSFAP